jgi:hypothetical protein
MCYQRLASNTDISFRELFRKDPKKDPKKAAALEAKLADFKDQVEELFPYLADEDICVGQVAIGSGYDLQGDLDPDYRKFCQFELHLRVGIGHELLQDLRTAVSVSYRHLKVKQDTWGVTQNQELSRPQKKAASRTTRISADYIHNWGKIETLLDLGIFPETEKNRHLRGLQNLDPSKDLKYYRTEGVQTQVYMGFMNRDVSWIWHVPMLGVESTSDEGKTKHALDEWIDECKLLGQLMH